MDLNTLTPIDSIEIITRVHTLIPYQQDRLLCLTNKEYFILNGNSLEIEDTKAVAISDDGSALDSSEDMLYYLTSVAQPSLLNYFLRKVKISTGETSVVTESGEDVNDPIIFDDKKKVIVSGGGLKIFSKDGQVVDLVEEAPPTTWKIFTH